MNAICYRRVYPHRSKGRGPTTDDKGGRNMSTTRRLFAILLTVALLLVNGSIGALAENVLTLPSALKVIGEEAFEGDTSIDKVVVPEGITAINARAFAGSSLSEINLPASVTTIGYLSFGGCDSVTRFIAPAGSYAYSYGVENRFIH